VSYVSFLLALISGIVGLLVRRHHEGKEEELRRKEEIESFIRENYLPGIDLSPGETMTVTVDGKDYVYTSEGEVVEAETLAVRTMEATVVEMKPRSPTKIATPPVYRLDAIARFFWSAKTYERVFEPVKADVLEEWYQAELAGRHRAAWWTKHVRGRWTMLCHMAMQLPFSLGKLVVEFVRTRWG
jgi:hypothetical protein